MQLVNMAPRMTLFRRLTLTSTGAAFLLVAIGGLVRATKSGLGCGTNWPHCPGAVNRALIIEFSHRATAGVLVLLLGALAFVAWRNLRHVRAVFFPALAAFGLVLFQAVLGAIVVWLELEAESVVMHLATAMLLLAVLIYLSAASLAIDNKLDVQSDPVTRRRAIGAAGGVFVLLLVGSYVTGIGAGNVFPDWPLMNGRVIPDLGIHEYAAHFLHRVMAAVVGIGVAVVALRIIRDKDRLPHQARFAHAALGLFVVQVLVGAANVWTDLAAAWVTLHLALGAAIWGCLVAVAVISDPVLQELRTTAPAHRARPAFEAS